MIRRSGVVLVVVATLVLTGPGCALMTKHRYAKLSAEEQRAHAGTETGYHQLSPYFAASVSGGTLSNRVMEFYYYPRGGGRPVLIGIVTALLDESADYGDQNRHFVLSGDGTELVYFHEEALQYGPVHKPDGLYRFKHGRGDVRVRAWGDRVILASDLG